jgi:hypothetical protein
VSKCLGNDLQPQYGQPQNSTNQGVDAMKLMIELPTAPPKITDRNPGAFGARVFLQAR